MNEPLYRRVLGAHFALLPPAVQRLHAGGVIARGRCTVERGWFLNYAAGWLMGLPRPGQNVAIEVRIEAHGDGEVWSRRFGDTPMRSSQSADRGDIIERVGPIAIRMAAHASVDGLDLAAIGGSAFGIAMPRGLIPRVSGSERVVNGKFHFDVAIRTFFGKIIRYHGWLVPDA